MRKLKLGLQLSYPYDSSNGDGSVSLRITDVASATFIADIDLSSKDFRNLMSTLGVEVSAEVAEARHLERVGQVMIVHSENVGRTMKYESEAANRHALELKATGWDEVEQRAQNTGLTFVMRRYVDAESPAGIEATAKRLDPRG